MMVALPKDEEKERADGHRIPALTLTSPYQQSEHGKLLTFCFLISSLVIKVTFGADFNS